VVVGGESCVARGVVGRWCGSGSGVWVCRCAGGVQCGVRCGVRVAGVVAVAVCVCGQCVGCEGVEVQGVVWPQCGCNACVGVVCVRVCACERSGCGAGVCVWGGVVGGGVCGVCVWGTGVQVVWWACGAVGSVCGKAGSGGVWRVWCAGRVCCGGVRGVPGVCVRMRRHRGSAVGVGGDHAAGVVGGNRLPRPAAGGPMPRPLGKAAPNVRSNHLGRSTSHTIPLAVGLPG